MLEGLQVEPVEDPEFGEQRHALRVGRKRKHLVVPVCAAQRINPDRLISGEILGAQQASAFGQVFDHQLARLAVIKLFRPVLLDALQGGGQLRHLECLPRLRGSIPRQEDARGLRIAAYLGSLPCDIQGESLRDGKSGTSELDGRFQSLRPAHRTKPSQGFGPAADSSRYGHAERSGFRHGVEAPGPEVGKGRGAARAAGGVEGIGLARCLVVIDEKHVSAHPVHVRTGYAENRGHGNRGVHRIATVAQHLQSRCGSQRVSGGHGAGGAPCIPPRLGIGGDDLARRGRDQE